MIIKVLCVAAATTAVASTCFAQVTAEQLATTEIRTEKVGDNLYVLFGVGGNIAVSIGAQGVLIVDAQFPEMVPKYRTAIRELGGQDINLAINTHWHYDHADGNKTLGPEGVWLVAQSKSRQMMTKNNVINTVVRPPFPQNAYPAAALPAATFDDRMQLHYNGEQIDLLHFGPAHTTGDAAVVFRGHNAVHMGDVFNNAGYPFIDADNGGDLDGTIAFCEAVLKELRPGAVVIPGHGAVAKYADLERYIEMLKGVRAKVSALIKDGATLEQVIAAKPTAEWDERYGDPTRMVNRAYAALSR
jgi:cyclase